MKLPALLSHRARRRFTFWLLAAAVCVLGSVAVTLAGKWSAARLSRRLGQYAHAGQPVRVDQIAVFLPRVHPDDNAALHVGKRLVKTPKVYFTDVGTLCHLVGLREPDHAASGPMGGVILETAVLSEIIRTLVHRGLEPRVYFWRTSTGREVDFVVEADQKLIPVEVKLSGTPRPAMAAGIKTFRDDLGRKVAEGYVVCLTDMRLPLGRGVTALPFTEF